MMNKRESERKMRFLSARQAVQVAAAASKPACLPKMPVPQMYDTFQKYLRSVRPFLSCDEYCKTEAAVNRIAAPGGVGEQLHSLLVERAQEEDNWLMKWWLNSAYLEFRAPVVVFSSPGQVFPKQNFKSEKDMLRCAANIIRAGLEFKSVIDKKSLKQEMAGGQPLDMVQYERIFGTCRIPCKPRDRLAFHPDSKHIVVMYDNDMYKVKVKKEGEWLSTGEILNQLKWIAVCTTCSGPPLGVLTSDSRDTWAENYKRLYDDAGNKKNLKTIEEALFVVCIDQVCPPPACNELTSTGLMLIHGGGPKVNGNNRWFDKTIQFIVGRDGTAGISYEHSPAEGGPIAVLTDYVLDRVMKDIEELPENEIDDKLKPERLCFSLDCDTKAAITTSQCNLIKLVKDLELNCFSFTDFGKDCIKSLKVSPDSFIQMAIQYAFYRMHKKPGAQYETGSLRRFSEGRTETVRSCSIESIRFIKAMMDGCIPAQSKANALRIAINSHKEYTNEAMSGRGVDRYLMGLQMIAKENNMVPPDIFNDESYTRSTHFRLSTSQVPSTSNSFMVYGPLVPNGYGVCYNPRQANINFGTSSFVSCDSTSAAKLKDVLQSCLNELRDVLTKSPQSKL